MIFVDTSFWVALRNRRDGHHAEARALLATHGDTTQVTTNHVRGETWTFLRHRVGHAAAVDFIDSLATSPRTRVVHVSSEVEQSAIDWLRTRKEREYSFVDATSFAVMRAERITRVLAFDGDFSAAGFAESCAASPRPGGRLSSGRTPAADDGLGGLPRIGARQRAGGRASGPQPAKR